MCPRVFTLYVVLWSASLNKFVSDRSRYFPVNLNYSSDTEEDFSQHFGMLQWCHVINEAKWSKAQPKDSHRPVIVFYHRSFSSATRRKLDPFGSIFSPLPVHRERECPHGCSTGWFTRVLTTPEDPSYPWLDDKYVSSYFQAMRGFIFVMHQMDLVSGSQIPGNLPSWRDNVSGEWTLLCDNGFQQQWKINSNAKQKALFPGERVSIVWPR